MDYLPKTLNTKELKAFLDEKWLQYEKGNFIETDPIQIPHTFSAREDIETSALLVAILSWGNRKQIIKSANDLLNRMDNAPYDFIMHFDPEKTTALNHFNYRTLFELDIKNICGGIKHIYKRFGSMEEAFIAPSGELKLGIIQFHKECTSVFNASRSLKHLPNIEKKSAGKRLNMFLRWMVRPKNKGVDFGLWKKISPADLYCPLDVHSGNTARKLGLLNRKANDWRSVENLTLQLKKMDPIDPIKYDYALFGLGAFEKFAS